jgi:muramidase (phage lysozyme)
MISKNLSAFLTMIGHSEGTIDVKSSDNGYNVIVGGGLFDSYNSHPRPNILCKSLGIYSSAAGRYQILARYFDAYKKQLGLPDFSPESQDKIAIQLIKECSALNDIEAGILESAIKKCSSRWASFPNAQYGQKKNSITMLKNIYLRAGGSLA